MRLPRCLFPGCSRRGNIVPLPLTGELVAVCDRHRGPRFLAHMWSLVAHG